MRQSAAEDVQGRKVETSGDLFGQHEGSVAIRAMRKVLPSGALTLTLSLTLTLTSPQP